MEEIQNTFNKAYDTHADRIFRLCYFKVSDRELATDMMQETFAKAFGMANEDETKIKNLKALLYRIARNLIVDEYRRRGRRDSITSLEVLEESGFEPGLDETDRLKDAIDGMEAIKLISKIKEPYGEAVLMKYVQELSLEEISEITGESENTISVRVHRGIAILKKLFNHEK